MENEKQRGEFDLIKELFVPLSKSSQGAFGLEDDACVVLPDPGFELVVTSDAIVSGVHFRADDPPDTIGRKLLRVNLSDLSAMGATPLGYILVVVLSAEHRGVWLDSFASGLAQDQSTYGLSLLGGDTVSTTGPSTFVVTAFGQARRGSVICRSGANVGDKVYVSGTLGDGVLGLMTLRGELTNLSDCDMESLINSYRIPNPRLALGRRLTHLASSAIDISDGLLADLGHLAKCSGVGVEIQESLIPMSKEVQRLVSQVPSLVQLILSGGDDYELAFTVPPSNQEAIEAAALDVGVPVSCIGTIVKTAGVRCLSGDGVNISQDRTGFTHF